MANKFSIFTLLASSLVVLNCSQKSTDLESATSTPLPADANIVQLTSDQIARANIKTGKIERELLADYVDCNGSIEADPNQKALVSPLMKGYVKRINVHLGDFVQKGTVLATLTHPDYVKLQQEYLEVLSQYEYYKADFRRQGELSIENATSIKNMQQVENDYRKTEVQLFALKKQLVFLGINPDSLYVENLEAEIKLLSPISGYVVQLNANLGMLCPEEKPIFEVVGRTNALLHLKVFENDAAKIASGQTVYFSLLNNTGKTYEATLKGTAKAIDQGNTINLHASIKSADEAILPGMYVKARILVHADSAYAVNEKAITRQNSTAYLFEKIDSTQFKAHKVKTGRIFDSNVELTDLDPELLEKEIVLAGAYYLLAEKNSEE